MSDRGVAGGGRATWPGVEVGSFDHYGRLVRRLLDVPVGLVSLVDPERQVFVGAVGLPDDYQASRQTPLSHSFCQYVVKDERPLIVSDARGDALLCDNLAIEDLDVVAYAGWPVTDHTGRTVGSLCAIDSRPREWTAADVATLEDLALACSAELTQRSRAAETAAALDASEEVGEQTRALWTLSTAMAATETLADIAEAVSRTCADELGCLHGGLWLRSSGRVEQGASARPRSVAPGRPASPETLTFVGDGVPAAGATWAAALRFAALPLDPTNPVGAALLEQRTLLFDERAQQNRAYPHLATPDQVGETRAFVPVVQGGRAYGTLVLVWPGRRRLSADDRLTVTALAAYTAQAVQRAQSLQDRVDAALTLQHAMLSDLPAPARLRLAARYRPAGRGEEVGGDWYDAVVAPSGATYLTIGDVEGHDMDAAAIMGQLRSMLRMTTWLETGTPAGDLASLDRAMESFGIEPCATAVLARVEHADDGPGHRLRWSTAGHPPPLLVDPDGTVTFLDDRGAHGPMLGLNPAAERGDAVLAVADGTLLLLYTDGLVERRGSGFDEGLERLRASAQRHASLDPDAFVDALLSELLGDDREDDVAVLAARFVDG